MSEEFLADRIEREKPDPVEGSSTRWLAVPPMLLSLFGIWDHLSVATNGQSPVQARGYEVAGLRSREC